MENGLTDRREEYARVFNDSYERVMKSPETSRNFYSEFYRSLMETSPEAARKFEHTDMKLQIRSLRASVGVLMAYSQNGIYSDYLYRLAERHGPKGVDIQPELYAVWLNCLIETVRAFDSRFNERVETAWRFVFSKGIEFMIAHANG